MSQSTYRPYILAGWYDPVNEAAILSVFRQSLNRVFTLRRRARRATAPSGLASETFERSGYNQTARVRTVWNRRIMVS